MSSSQADRPLGRLQERKHHAARQHGGKQDRSAMAGARLAQAARDGLVRELCMLVWEMSTTRLWLYEACRSSQMSCRRKALSVTALPAAFAKALSAVVPTRKVIIAETSQLRPPSRHGTLRLASISVIGP